YIVAVNRAPSDTGTLWVGLRRGRVFVSSNVDKASGAVIFYRIDTPSTPTRFVSGIAVDPSDPNHAFVSFSGYNAYAMASGTATGNQWASAGANLPPVATYGLTIDSTAHILYAATHGRGAWSLQLP